MIEHAAAVSFCVRALAFEARTVIIEQINHTMSAFAMTGDSPPIVLTFGLSDPTSGSGFRPIC